MMHAIQSRSGLAFCFAAAVAVTTCGCGDSDAPTMASVKGTVLYNGEQLEGAVVLFTPLTVGQTARGITDAQGRFQLSTSSDNDGAVIGNHLVTISKREQYDAPEQDPDRPPIPDTRPPPKSLIPEKYGQVRESPFKSEVTADGENDFKFELTDLD